MVEQLALFSPNDDFIQPDYDGAESIEERFERFHRANPHVARRLREMALQLKRKGRQHYGMKALFEVLRFSHALQTTGDVFKLNNNYTALYARMLMDQNPELDGFFETRQRRVEPI